MMLATLARHRWTGADYERMIAAGMFEKIELLCGDVVITGARLRPLRNLPKRCIEVNQQSMPDAASSLAGAVRGGAAVGG